MMLRKLLLLVLFIAFTSSLSACGRKNQPVAPEGADPQYPRSYPAPLPVPNSK
ncbi:conserved exported hypothetical protein [Candidatus Terasakiella magnetica]|uniref:Lipoprotein n=1 Tax=Candidatus Terasakiella magnetica TaxID=1867952 RepID=A0A1C3RGW9_9PROT|nr:lipoprotein [Candidatus Terasakiella magnetica]SCA56510.1 conserved exported hypothetical protein [Candidatus Terasakiella magnetica]